MVVRAFGFFLLLGLPQLVADPAPRYPTAAETRAEFEEICRSQREIRGSYFGNTLVPELEKRLEEPMQSLEMQATIRGRLGVHLRRVSRMNEALAQLDEALRLLEGRDGTEELRLRLTLDLAMTHLLHSEDVNCVQDHTPTKSCRIPIAPEAVHRFPEPARRAGDLYAHYLEARPENIEARWFLNLTRMITGDYPQAVPESLRLPTGALDSAIPFPAWQDLAAGLGVDSIDLAGGAVMDDFDGDGLLDLVSSTWDPCEAMKAFRNDGRGGFEDVTHAWGLDAQFGGLNLVHADYDNDGHLDLLVLRGAWQGLHGQIRNSLLRNDLDGPTKRFVDVTIAAGLTTKAPTQTAAWADYDLDGDLDLYIGNEADADRLHFSELLRNEGDGTFTDVTAEARVANARFAKGVTWGDYDNDGDPDLYISNMEPNRLYRNEGPDADGKVVFSDVAWRAGVRAPEAESFPTWFFDYDNDGDLDLFVASYSATAEEIFASYLDTSTSGKAPRQAGYPVLYRNDGPGPEGQVSFTDVSKLSGLTRPLLPMGANYGDLDNDGYLDFYLGTGYPDLRTVTPNVMYKNDGGKRFLDVSSAGSFSHIQKGHGIAFGDLDNDGDQDLFEQMGGSYPVDSFFNALYENPGFGAHWITLRLVGTRSNRFALGARIEVRVREAGRQRSVHLLAGSGGSFGSSSLQQEIGLGQAETIEAVLVRWPGSTTAQDFGSVEMDQTYRAIEGEPHLIPLEVPSFRLKSHGAVRKHPMAHGGS